MTPGQQPTPEVGRTLPEVLAVMSDVRAELKKAHKENEGLADILQRFTLLIDDQSQLLQKQSRIIDGQSVELDRQQRELRRIVGYVAEH